MAWRLADELNEDEFRDFKASYRKKSRFLVDESLGPEAARVLRDLGWNVVFVADVGLNSRDDQDVYAYAWREDRIILTHDTDFLDDKRFPPNRNPGVVVLPGASGSPAPLERELARLHLIVAPYREAHRHSKIYVGAEREWTVNAWSKNDGKHHCRRLKFEPGGRILEWHE
jgi:predicted nuclease of predicted toxin-antitoxin system